MPSGHGTKPVSPAVTVVVLTCNRSGYLRECLDSIRGQTFRDWELVLSDCSDVSAHRSRIESIFEEMAATVPSGQCRMVKQGKRIPQASHLGTVIPGITTPYVALMDDDDVWADNHLERAIASMSENRQLGLVISNGIVISETGAQAGFTNAPDHRFPALADCAGWLSLFLRSFYGSTSSYVIRKAAIEKHVYFDTSCVDLSLAITVLLEGFKVTAFGAPSYYYRVHGESSYQKGDQVVIDRHRLRLWLLRNKGAQLCRTCPIFLPLALKSFAGLSLRKLRSILRRR